MYLDFIIKDSFQIKFEEKTKRILKTVSLKIGINKIYEIYFR
jgi:hypothetical protein